MSASWLSDYLIWSNEHVAWWKAGGFGYTKRLHETRRYSRDEAIAICTKAMPGNAARSGFLHELPVRDADAAEMQHAYHALYPNIPLECWE